MTSEDLRRLTVTEKLSKELKIIIIKKGKKKRINLKKKINHQISMDDIKLLTKNGKYLETLIQAGKIYTDEIGIKFGIKKLMLIMKSRKRLTTE